MAKSAIHLYQTAGVRQALASIFKSVKELDENHKQQVSYIYGKTDFRKDKKQRLQRLLNIIKTHSVCESQGYLGVCFLSIKNMMALFSERYGKKISERCMQYLLRDLEELKLIERIETIRMSDNRQSTNIYRTRKMESQAPAQPEADKQPVAEHLAKSQPAQKREAQENRGEDARKPAPKESGKVRPKKAHYFFKAPLKILKHIQERSTAARKSNRAAYAPVKTDPSARLLNFVPKDFKELFAAITTSPREIYEYWRVAKYACEAERGLGRSETKKTYEAAFAEFYDAIKAASKGKFEMLNPFGFYCSVMRSYAGQTFRKLRTGDDFGRLNVFCE